MSPALLDILDVLRILTKAQQKYDFWNMAVSVALMSYIIQQEDRRYVPHNEIETQSGGRQSSGKVINAALAITKFYVFLLFVTSVRRTAGQPPTLKPTCEHLEPTPCTVIHSKDKNGKYDSRYYYEECSHHACVKISPVKPPPPGQRQGIYHWLPPSPPLPILLPEDIQLDAARDKAASYFKKISGNSYPSQFELSKSRYENESVGFKDTTNPTVPPRPFRQPQFRTEKDVRIHERMSKYWDPNLVGVDSEGRFVRADLKDFWFCSGAGPEHYYLPTEGVNYDARVTTNTQRVLGRTEDMKAHCEFLRFLDLVVLSSCDLTGFSCTFDCLPAARAFYCAVYLPMCRPAPGHVYGTGINRADNKTQNVVYIPNNLPPDVKIKASYVIVKPCRGLCWGVKRTCPRQITWACHLKESRDFTDAPDCNSVEDELAFNMFI